jgi:hypothetical protein
MIKKVFIHSLLLLLGVVVGSSIGALGCYWYAKHKVAVAEARLSPVEASHLRTTRELLFRVFSYNAGTVGWSPTKAELPKKLTDQTKALENLADGAGSPELRPLISVYLSFGYVRLARLADEKGDHSGAHGYMAKAKAECETAGWKECSDSALRSSTESWVRGYAPNSAQLAGDYR